MVFVADASHFFVESSGGVIVSGHSEADVELTFPEVVGLRVVFEPRQFQAERAEFVAEIDNFESPFGSVDFAAGFQSQCFLVECDASFEVCHIDVEVVKFCLYVHDLKDCSSLFIVVHEAKVDIYL